jgi:hypothetical protein
VKVRVKYKARLAASAKRVQAAVQEACLSDKLRHLIVDGNMAPRRRIRVYVVGASEDAPPTLSRQTYEGITACPPRVLRFVTSTTEASCDGIERIAHCRKARSFPK